MTEEFAPTGGAVASECLDLDHSGDSIVVDRAGGKQVRVGQSMTGPTVAIGRIRRFGQPNDAMLFGISPKFWFLNG